MSELSRTIQAGTSQVAQAMGGLATLRARKKGEQRQAWRDLGDSLRDVGATIRAHKTMAEAKAAEDEIAAIEGADGLALGDPEKRLVSLGAVKVTRPQSAAYLGAKRREAWTQSQELTKRKFDDAMKSSQEERLKAEAERERELHPLQMEEAKAKQAARAAVDELPNAPEVQGLDPDSPEYARALVRAMVRLKIMDPAKGAQELRAMSVEDMRTKVRQAGIDAQNSRANALIESRSALLATRLNAQQQIVNAQLASRAGIAAEDRASREGIAARRDALVQQRIDLAAGAQAATVDAAMRRNQILEVTAAGQMTKAALGAYLNLIKAESAALVYAEDDAGAWHSDEEDGHIATLRANLTKYSEEAKTLLAKLVEDAGVGPEGFSGARAGASASETNDDPMPEMPADPSKATDEQLKAYSAWKARNP